MSIKIEVKGIRSTKKFLRKKQNITKKQSSIALFKSAIFLQGEVKSSIAGRRAEPTSVDTGRLLNSVDLKVGNNDATIFTKIPYGKFIEFGTSKLNPRRHFNNSKDRGKKKIKKIFQNNIKNI